MSAPSINSQATCRAFAFGDQAQTHATPEGIGADQPAFEPAKSRAHMSARARDLHARADLMFRCGYDTSGWVLRQAAWKAEGRA